MPMMCPSGSGIPVQMANGHHVADNESRVAVLVDCDNTTPENLEYVLRAVAQFGRVVPLQWRDCRREHVEWDLTSRRIEAAAE